MVTLTNHEKTSLIMFFKIHITGSFLRKVIWLKQNWKIYSLSKMMVICEIKEIKERSRTRKTQNN